MDDYEDEKKRMATAPLTRIIKTPCGEQKTFHCLKTLGMWDRLHRKKCDLCKDAKVTRLSTQLVNFASSASQVRENNQLIRNEISQLAQLTN